MTHHRMMMHPCVNYRMPMAKNKEVMTRTRIHVKLIFSISRSKVKVINIRDTSCHNDTPICQIWCAYFKELRSYGQDTNLHRQKDSQSDSYIPPPPKLVCGGGYNNSEVLT